MHPYAWWQSYWINFDTYLGNHKPNWNYSDYLKIRRVLYNNDGA